VNLGGTKELAAPREVVWSVIEDPLQLVGLLPGVEGLEIEDDRHWTATVKVPLGIGGLRLAIAFETLEERRLEYRLLEAKGKGAGALMAMTTSLALTGEGDCTSMEWSADVRIAGPVSSMGQRVLRPLVDQQVANVLAALEAKVADVGTPA
jgi:carbon monoxide dehydrogenase subunit G